VSGGLPLSRLTDRLNAPERRAVLAAAVLVLFFALLGAMRAGPASAAPPALFPSIPPPTQIAREVSLPQAAQAGVVNLKAKGGSEGDAVSLELNGKKIKWPITITVRAEITVTPRLTPEKRAIVQKDVPKWQQETQDELNRVAAKSKTKSGDQIHFVVDFQYREPEAPARSNYHQIQMINPLVDTPDDPNARSGVADLVPPNGSASTTGTWVYDQMDPEIMAHETLHLVGLDDRYTDVYVYKGKQYPLPERGMKPADLAKFLKEHQPPLPPPPAGKVDFATTPGTEKCDIMNESDASCRKISKRDLEWIESETGILVTAQPSEMLLDKSSDHQNFGVGFQTIVFASPGSTTVANGISVYCLDHDRFTPLDQTFDVGPQTSQVPGYGDVGKLLALNAGKQSGLSESLTGMQAAIWNLTDAAPLATSGYESEARGLMGEAGVAESSNPSGLAAISDPNAGNAATGAVDASGSVMPPIAAEAVPPAPPFRFYTAAVYPKSLRTGAKLHADLLLGASGEVSTATIVIQRKKGKRWKKLRKLSARGIESGTAPLSLAFGKLRPGGYRLLVSVAGEFGDPQTLPATFKVTR
jgi:hypothetical protein